MLVVFGAAVATLALSVLGSDGKIVNENSCTSDSTKAREFYIFKSAVDAILDSILIALQGDSVELIENSRCDAYSALERTVNGVNAGISLIGRTDCVDYTDYDVETIEEATITTAVNLTNSFFTPFRYFHFMDPGSKYTVELEAEKATYETIKVFRNIFTGIKMNLPKNCTGNSPTDDEDGGFYSINFTYDKALLAIISEIDYIFDAISYLCLGSSINKKRCKENRFTISNERKKATFAAEEMLRYTYTKIMTR